MVVNFFFNSLQFKLQFNETTITIGLFDKKLRIFKSGPR